MNYNYEGSRQYAESLGVTFKEQWFENFDQQAKAMGFSQAQVSVSIQNHLWVVRKKLLNPKEYVFKDKVKMALKLLLGAKK